jgi:hypothetical protein
MGKVIVDAETLAKLKGLDQPLEFYDEAGNLLAYCMPVDAGMDSLPSLSGPNPFTDEEIADALKDTDPGRPLADILADLRRRYP